MNDIIFVSIAALITSLLTFFSGFGLGTILTPVFAIFFPIELAIALTGIVHFLNNIFKLFLIGGKTDKQVALRFGLPAFFAAFVGALLLVQLSALPALYSYSLGGKTFSITPVKLIIAFLLLAFAVIEWISPFGKIQIDKNKLFVGGLLSGFFGGLSGNQGALRSAFLIKSGLSKEAFIATGIAIACLVDFSRLAVYASRFSKSGLIENFPLVIAATLSAFVGAYAGSRLLSKITIEIVQAIVTVMLVLLSVALGLGFI